MSQCHDLYPAEGYEPSDTLTVPGTQCHDLSSGYEDDDVEILLANAVREWAERVAPGDEATAQVGVETALYLFASGASVIEACEQTRRRLLSRFRHPSHPRAPRPMATAR